MPYVITPPSCSRPASDPDWRQDHQDSRKQRGHEGRICGTSRTDCERSRIRREEALKAAGIASSGTLLPLIQK